MKTGPRIHALHRRCAALAVIGAAGACAISDGGATPAPEKEARGTPVTLDTRPRPAAVFARRAMPRPLAFTMDAEGFTMEDARVTLLAHASVRAGADTPLLRREMKQLMIRVIENVFPCFTLQDMGAARVLEDAWAAQGKKYRQAFEWQLRRTAAFSFAPSPALAEKVARVFREQVGMGALEHAGAVTVARVELDSARAELPWKTVRRIMSPPRRAKPLVSAPDLCP